MKRCTFGILAAVVITWAVPTKAAITVFDEMLETMMEAAAHDSLYIGHFFGADKSAVLQFTSNLDPVTGDFSYAILPGQSYVGLPMSLSTVGSYDPALRQANWTISGELGGESWFGDGSAVWMGNPTGAINTQVTLGGNVYQVSGMLEYEVSVFGRGNSSGTYTFTGPPGGPGGPGPFGPYEGTDRFLQGRWVHKVRVPVNPIVPDGLIIFAAGEVPFPNGGPGTFEVRITPIPEPPSLALWGGIVVLFVLIGYSRHPRKATGGRDKITAPA